MGSVGRHYSSWRPFSCAAVGTHAPVIMQVELLASDGRAFCFRLVHVVRGEFVRSPSFNPGVRNGEQKSNHSEGSQARE
jgi:hypothetical protein